MSELSPTTPRSGHVPGTSAPFPTPTCAYKETPSTKSHVTTAMNNTLGALHVSYTIAYENTLTTKTPP